MCTGVEMRILGRLLIVFAYPALLLGLILYENHVCGWPRSLWEDAVCKAPDKARNQANLGMAYMHQGQFNIGLEHLALAERIARERPTVDSDAQHVGPNAVASMSAFYIETSIPKNLEKADQILEAARNHYPPNEGVLANSIELMLRDGDLERAEGLAIAALKQLPHSPWIYVQRAEVAAMRGECDLRARLLLGAAKQQPMIAIHIARGVIQLRPCVDSGGF